MQRFWVMLACTASLVAPAPCLGAALRDVAPPLRKAVLCMAKVLKAETGVSDVKISVSVGPNSIDSGLMLFAERGWVHPFIDYTAIDRSGHRERLRFVSMRGIRPDWNSLNDVGSDEFSFMTMLNGLSAVGEGPDDVGTRAVMAKWRTVCGVDVNALYN